MTNLVEGLKNWMQECDYVSLNDLKGGMSQLAVADPSAFERANYIRILENYKSAYLVP
jgi:dihydroorotate dehydrogenase (fumarate)